jgi:hypothetical protein
VVRFVNDSGEAAYIADGYSGGQRYVKDNIDRWHRVKAPNPVFELPNEPDCNTNTGIQALNAFTLGAIDTANNYGVKLVCFNFAEGNPHDNGEDSWEPVKWKWGQFVSSLKAMSKTGHYLGRHAYWRPGVEGPLGQYHALGRVAWDISTILSLGINPAELRVLVNEFGIDGGIAGHTAQQGWKMLVTEREYINQVVEAEIGATKMPQVVAMFLFTSGFYQPWQSYDHDQNTCANLSTALKSIVLPETKLFARPIDKHSIVKVTNRFNPPEHYGVDYSCYVGTPIYAACDGLVYRGDQGNYGFGKYLRIEKDAYYVYTAHLSEWLVESGDSVKKGQWIGVSGNTGNSTGPHLHFEVRKGNRQQTSAIDPER